jgi:hypothetical protein
MKGLTALLSLLLVSSASAQSLEALRAGADLGLIHAVPMAVHPDLEKPREPILQKHLVPMPMQPSRSGAVVGTARLSALHSANRRVMAKQFGARTLDLGVGTDAGFKSYFFTFSDAKTTTLAAIGDVNRLRGDGVNARIDAATVYNFKVAINIFSPVRGSTLKMTPVQGTKGPKHEVKTGVVLDAIRAKSFVFKAKGQEFWMLYDNDVLPDGSGYADTRSFLFIKEDGLSSKAWPLAESALTVDAAGTVDLGGVKLTLTRTSGGELVIRE